MNEVFFFRQFHKFVRERFSEEPEDKKQNIISNIILVRFFSPLLCSRLSNIYYQAVINSVELYLNHESLGQQLSINIVQIFNPEDNMETFPEIR